MRIKKMEIVKYDMRLNKDRLPMLVKEASLNYTVNDSLTTPLGIVRYLNDTEDFENLVDEKVMMICFNAKLRAIGTFVISMGSINTSIVPIRDVFMRALAIGACFISIAHNHPSGDPDFSKQDIDTALKIRDIGNMLEIKLLDFIAVGNNERYESMHQDGSL